MSKFYIICLSFLLPTLIWAQQEIKFTVEVSTDTVNLNETINIKYKIEGTEYRDFQLPEFVGFQVASGPFQSTSIQYLNGDMSRETSYSYRIIAIDAGTFTFPPASIIVGDKTMKTEAIEITVVSDGSAKPRPKIEPQPKFYDPFLKPKKKKEKTISI